MTPSATSRTKRVFISYVRENAELVDRLKQTIEIYGIEAWVDRDRLKPGELWEDEIRRGIKNGDFYLACFSEEYNNREKSYMNEELTLAIEELRMRPTDRAWFIPILLSDTQVPDRRIGAGVTLRSLQSVALYADWNAGMQKILSVIDPEATKLHELVDNLRSNSARVRIKAADDLGRLGKIARLATVPLLELVDDPNETVRAIAYEALGKVAEPSPELLRALLLASGSKHPDYAGSKANEALIKLINLL